jgi:hypothetical protein
MGDYYLVVLYSTIIIIENIGNWGYFIRFIYYGNVIVDIDRIGKQYSNSNIGYIYNGG